MWYYKLMLMLNMHTYILHMRHECLCASQAQRFRHIVITTWKTTTKQLSSEERQWLLFIIFIYLFLSQLENISYYMRLQYLIASYSMLSIAGKAQNIDVDCYVCAVFGLYLLNSKSIVREVSTILLQWLH